MAKINGTLLLVYADGVVIAAQKGVSVNVNQNLPDASTKESAGWAEHINGQRDCEVTIEGLISTTGKTAHELYDYIMDRKSLLLVVDGFTYPYVMEANVSASSINAPAEEAAGLSGTFRANGAMYHLSGDNANLITDPDAGGEDYETLTISGIAITSAINAAGSAYCNSNEISVSEGDIIKVFVFLTLTSGQAPSISVWDNTSADISNKEALVEGANFITLTVTGTDASASIRISNTDAANFALSNIYAFKV